MSLGRNVLAGMANSIWTGVVGLVAVPLYLKYLGISNYGLIGLCATIQALLLLLDLGLAATMNREMARCSALGKVQEGRKLLRTLAVVYWLMAILIAALAFALAPLAARYWLQAASVDNSTLRNAVMLMGLVVACRWPIGLYQGALMGVNRLTLSSSINMVMTTLSSFGAVAVLAWISPTVEAFFLWQAFVAIAHALTMRAAAWMCIGKEGAGRFNPATLAGIWRFSAGMSGIAISSTLLMHLDKVLLSKMLTLEAFGQYALAGVVVSALYVLLTPMFNVIYPRMSALVAKGETDYLLEHYRFGTQLMGSLVFPVTIGIALFADDLVFVWTGNEALSTSIAPIVATLIFGTAFNGIMLFPFALQLAHGRTDMALAISISLTVVLVPMLVFLTRSHGAVGGAQAWLFLNIIYLTLGSWITNRTFFRERRFSWLGHDVGIPLLGSIAIIYLGSMVWHADQVGFDNVWPAALLTVLAIATNLLLLPRALAKRLVRGQLGWT